MRKRAITSLQCRMAKVALRWTMARFAREAGIDLASATRYLNGNKIPTAEVRSIRWALERAGIVFLAEGDRMCGGFAVGFRDATIAEIKTSGPATEVVKLMDVAIAEDKHKKR